MKVSIVRALKHCDRFVMGRTFLKPEVQGWIQGRIQGWIQGWLWQSDGHVALSVNTSRVVTSKLELSRSFAKLSSLQAVHQRKIPHAAVFFVSFDGRMSACSRIKYVIAWLIVNAEFSFFICVVAGLKCYRDTIPLCWNLDSSWLSLCV